MPLSYERYYHEKKLEHNYYRVYIGNFIIFYYVEENFMKISRIIYSKRDLKNIVKEEIAEYSV